MRRPFALGQGLLEATLAIGMILVGLGAILSLTLQNVAATVASNQRLTAAQLAREGLDAIRQVRDSNWLKATNSQPSTAWDQGLADSVDCGLQCNAALVIFTPGDPTPPAQASTLEVRLLSDVYAAVPSRDVDGDVANMPELEFYRHNQDHEWVQFDSLPALAGYGATNYRRIVLLDPVCREDATGTVRTRVNQFACDGGESKIGLRAEATVSWPSASAFGGQGRRKLTLVEYLYNWR